jgi:hypothetical protein
MQIGKPLRTIVVEPLELPGIIMVSYRSLRQPAKSLLAAALTPTALGFPVCRAGATGPARTIARPLLASNQIRAGFGPPQNTPRRTIIEINRRD